MNDDAKDIRIDWEHTDYRFIRPNEIQNYDTVPRLQQSLSRIVVGPETESGLKALKDDHHSGAGVLALIALETLLKIVRGEDLKSAKTTEEFWKEIRMVAWHLAKNGRPSMGPAIEAVLYRVLNTIQAELQRSAATGYMELSALKALVEKTIEARIIAGRHSLDSIMLYFEQFMAQAEHLRQDKISTTTIVTLSLSSTITQTLAYLIGRSAAYSMNIKLCILESRPMFEGVAFANALLDSLEKKLNELGILPEISSRLQVEIFSDASAATVVKTANYLIIGADKVSSNGDVSNKIGSLAAAVLAKTLRPDCKVVVLFETDKIAGDGDSERLRVEYNDQTEITKAWPSSYSTALQQKREKGFCVEVKNAYFEWVPAAYVDQYISEEGPLRAQDITRLSQEKAELEERLFSDL